MFSRYATAVNYNNNKKKKHFSSHFMFSTRELLYITTSCLTKGSQFLGNQSTSLLVGKHVWGSTTI